MPGAAGAGARWWRTLRGPADGQPSLDDWRWLYEEAARFLAAAPWTDLTDAQAIAVEDPDSREPAFCAVLGAGGQEFGLSAYRGVAGLNTYNLVLNDWIDGDEALLIQDSLTFLLGDREHPGPEERAAQRALGLRFRGKGRWPFFRSYRPGYLPASPTAAEARRLASCLQQVTDFITELRRGALLPPVEAGMLLTRRPGGDGRWQTAAMVCPALPEGPDLELDDVSLQRLRRRARASLEVWQVGLQVVSPIHEKGAPPFWGWTLVCLEEDSGFLRISGVGGPSSTIQQQFVNALSTAGVIPRQVRVVSPYLEEQLDPLAQALGVGLECADFLPELEAARQALDARFR